MSLLLAIDTSTDMVGVALHDGELVSDSIWSAKLRQTATLLQGVDDVLSEAGRSIADITVVAVAIGPGSFSGLRVGLSVAKGLVLSQDVALVGVSTLLATAYSHVGWQQSAVAVVNAGRGRYVWALVEHGDPDPVEGAWVNGTADELFEFVESLDRDILVCGEVPSELVTRTSVGRHIHVRPSPGRRAAAVSMIGWGRWQRGEVDDPATLEPAYLHLTSPT